MDASKHPGWLHYYPELEQLSDPDWVNVLKEFKYIQVPSQTTIHRAGNPCKGLLFLIDGGVRVFMRGENGREMILYRFQQGDVCVLTLTMLLKSADYGVEAVTDAKSKVAFLPARHFRQAFEGSPGFRNFILHKLACGMHDTLFLLQEVAFERLDMRLACLLFRRFRQHRGNVLVITHQQLAQDLATTREVVSRLLKDLEQQQCIRLRRGRIELLDDRGLAQISSTNTLTQQVAN